MKIAITGASGHLGANLVRILNAKGICPRVLVYQNSNSLDDVAVERVEGDVLDVNSLKQCFDGIDMVYHLAAKISLATKDDGEIQQTNVTGTRNTVTACLDRQVQRLVNVSSIHAFNPLPSDQEVNESRIFLQKNEGYPYERSKANALREIEIGLQQGLNAINIFPTGLIGPYDFMLSHMGKFFLDLYHGAIPMIVRGGFNFADIRDVANGILTAGETAKKGEHFILGGHYASARELSNYAHEITGKKIPQIALPIPLITLLRPLIKIYAHATGKGEIYNSMSPVALDALKNYRHINHTKSKNELNYQSRSLRETIKDIYAWFDKAGYLKKN